MNCSENSEQVEERLERWRHALEKRGMKVSSQVRQNICVSEKETGGRVQGEEVGKVNEFKYLGSTI